MKPETPIAQLPGRGGLGGARAAWAHGRGFAEIARGTCGVMTTEPTERGDSALPVDSVDSV